MQELMPMGDQPLVPVIINPYDDVVNEVTSGGDFLPRVQLFIATSDMVKQETIVMNHYGLVTGKDQVEDLGREVDALIICWRPRALDFSDKANIRSSSDVKSELFKEIQEQSGEQNSGCMFGAEYLLWVPSRQLFATIIFGSKSGRMEARNIMQFVGKACTFKSKLITTSKFSWQSPCVTTCSTPFDIPTHEAQVEVADKFLHPKEQPGAEKVVATEQRDR